MPDAMVLELRRSETATTQLIIKTFLSVVMSIALIGYAMTAPDPTLRFAAWIGALLSLLLLGLRVMTLINSRIPLRITQDQVIISSSAKVTVSRAHITGAGHHPKSGHPCLYFDDPEKGHKGPLRLPVRFINLDHPALLAQLVGIFGVVPSADQDQT